MRSHEERFAETKRRIAARQRREQRRRSTITTLSAAAACLVLIVGVSFAMPGMVAGVRPGDFAGYETAASMYGGGAALGYIVIGLLSFLFGRVRDRFVLPAASDEPRGRSEQRKRWDSWS